MPATGGKRPPARTPLHNNKPYPESFRKRRCEAYPRTTSGFVMGASIASTGMEWYSPAFTGATGDWLISGLCWLGLPVSPFTAVSLQYHALQISTSPPTPEHHRIALEKPETGRAPKDENCTPGLNYIYQLTRTSGGDRLAPGFKSRLADFIE